MEKCKKASDCGHLNSLTAFVLKGHCAEEGCYNNIRRCDTCNRRK